MPEPTTPDAREALEGIRARYPDIYSRKPLDTEPEERRLLWQAEQDIGVLLAALTPAGPEERGEGLRKAAFTQNPDVPWRDETLHYPDPEAAATPAPDSGAGRETAEEMPNACPTCGGVCGDPWHRWAPGGTV